MVVHKCEWCGLCFTYEEDLPHHQKQWCRNKPIANPVAVSTNDENIEGSTGSSVVVGDGAKQHRCHVCGMPHHTRALMLRMCQ